MKKGYIETRQGQVHYRADGETGPYLFLLHLTPFSSRMFELALPRLGRHCRAIALDTPGYGNSDPPPAPISIADYGERMLEAIDRITSGPFALCGFSTGAAIALEIARRVSARTDRLILSTTPVMTKDELKALVTANIGEPEMAPDGSHFLRRLARSSGRLGRGFRYPLPSSRHRGHRQRLRPLPLGPHRGSVVQRPRAARRGALSRAIPVGRQ